MASPPRLATVRSDVPALTDQRAVPPRLLYLLGAGLILIGIGGFMYSLYGAPDRIEQWLGERRQAVSSQESAENVPSQSVAPVVDATAPSSSAYGEAGTRPWVDDAATTATRPAIPSSSVPMSETARDAEANTALAQTAAPTTAEVPASSAIQTSPATRSTSADASAAPQVAATPTKHPPRAKRRAATRKTAPSRSEIPPQ
jgi:hypothetical protein